MRSSGGKGIGLRERNYCQTNDNNGLDATLDSTGKRFHAFRNVDAYLPSFDVKERTEGKGKERICDRDGNKYARN
jgi:hypothetical protein